MKVTDYKTGVKSFDITALYHGLQMQLPVYMNAALEAERKQFPGREVVPAGIFYYRIQDPVVDRQDSDEAVEKSILKELRLDGLINDEGAALEHLERGLAGASVLIPAGRNKDGSLSRSSRALPGDAFRTVLKYTQEKEGRIREDILSGRADAAPYQMKDATGCDYCAYRDICGFDLRISGCRYRRLENYSMEEAVAKMTEETEKDGGTDK